MTDSQKLPWIVDASHPKSLVAYAKTVVEEDAKLFGAERLDIAAVKNKIKPSLYGFLPFTFNRKYPDVVSSNLLSDNFITIPEDRQKSIAAGWGIRGMSGADNWLVTELTYNVRGLSVIASVVKSSLENPIEVVQVKPSGSGYVCDAEVSEELTSDADMYAIITPIRTYLVFKRYLSDSVLSHRTNQSPQEIYTLQGKSIRYNTVITSSLCLLDNLIPLRIPFELAVYLSESMNSPLDALNDGLLALRGLFCEDAYEIAGGFRFFEDLAEFRHTSSIDYYIHSDGGTYTCEEDPYGDEDDSRGEEGLYGYCYKPKARFHYVGATGEVKVSKSEPSESIVYGIENELELDEETDIYSAITLWDKKCPSDLHRNFIYPKSDGSINYGAEFVTHPATLRAHNILWRGYKSAGVFESSSWDTASNVGMHIHISRSKLTPDTIQNIIDTVNSRCMFPFLVNIARRSPNGYCFLNAGADGKLGIKKSDPSIRYSYQDRYHSVNTCPSKTIELRMFQSSRDPSVVLRQLQFVDILVKFCNPNRFSRSKLRISNFLQFARRTIRESEDNLYKEFGLWMEAFIQRNGSVWKSKALAKDEIDKVHEFPNMIIGEEFVAVNPTVKVFRSHGIASVCDCCDDEEQVNKQQAA